ncbi:MAG TPA: tetratricopeptide repeat protein [Gemmatimonadales bacterium]|nr:tetratricopeptide repeat protein [Gemmatimonadales bacterium]
MATTVPSKKQQQGKKIQPAPATQPVPAAPAAAPFALAGWARAHIRLGVGALAAVALVLLGIWFVISSNRRKQEYATRLLSQALATADQGNLPQAAGDLQKLIQTYHGTSAATEAVIALNQVRLVSGQGELAAQNLREFVATNPPPRYAASAYGLLGAAEENTGKPAEAAQAYEKAAASTELDYLKADYLVEAGRAYTDAGKASDAIRVYRTVVEKYTTSPSFGEAQVRLAELTAGASS